MRLAKPENIAVLQRLLGNRLPVDIGAGRVLQVGDDDMVGRHADLTVDPGGEEIVNAEVAVLPAIAEGDAALVGQDVNTSFVGPVDNEKLGSHAQSP